MISGLEKLILYLKCVRQIKNARSIVFCIEKKKTPRKFVLRYGDIKWNLEKDLFIEFTFFMNAFKCVLLFQTIAKDNISF